MQEFLPTLTRDQLHLNYSWIVCTYIQGTWPSTYTGEKDGELMDK